VRFAVEAWDPEYGVSVDAGLDDSRIPVDPWVERAEAAWAPISPAADVVPEPCLQFVDGVRRVEANVWVSAPDGSSHLGICASYAAGVVRCEEQAVIGPTLVERAIFCAPEGAGPVETRHGTFGLHAVTDTEDDPTALTLALQRDMTRLEVEVARAAPGELIVVDGPLKEGQVAPGFVGYVKTHRTRYGPPLVMATVARLGVGERTPILHLGGPRPRFTWYLRLPGPIAHGMAGVVRLEVAAEGPVADTAVLADRLAVSLPRFASIPHKDSRAPQNLFPIAGLERELRRRLGDPHLLVRALREAAASAG
jgi:hypothetical protein